MDLERIVVEGQLPGKEGVERRKVREKLVIKRIVVDKTHEEDGGGLVRDGEIHEERRRLP